MSGKQIAAVLGRIRKKLNEQKKHISRAVTRSPHGMLGAQLNCFWNIVLEDFYFARTCSTQEIRNELHRRGVDNYPALREMYGRVGGHLSNPNLFEEIVLRKNIGRGDWPEFQGRAGCLLGITSLLVAIPVISAPPGELTPLGMWLSASQQLLRNEYFMPHGVVMHDDSMYTLMLMGVALSLCHLSAEENPFVPDQLPVPLEQFSPHNLLLDDFVIQKGGLLQPDKVWLVGRLLPFWSPTFGVYDIFEREKVRLYFPDEAPSGWVSQKSYMTPDFMRVVQGSLKER